MFSKLSKKIKKLLLSKSKTIRKMKDDGIFAIPIGIVLGNFIFQRILRINSNSKWSVHFTSVIVAPDRIKIGKRVAFSLAVCRGYYIQGVNGITIGDNTIFASGIKIISSNHDPYNFKRPVKAKPITIGANCWIGANAVILPGVSLGDHTIVGAGAIVTKSFPGNMVIAGNPARIIKKLDEI